jgi:hypothetical protein
MSCLASAQNLVDSNQDKPVIKKPLVNISIADHLFLHQTSRIFIPSSSNDIIYIAKMEGSKSYLDIVKECDK